MTTRLRSGLSGICVRFSTSAKIFVVFHKIHTDSGALRGSCEMGIGALLTFLLTPCSSVLIEKLTGFAANQEIPRILWNPKVHHRTHKLPLFTGCKVTKA